MVKGNIEWEFNTENGLTLHINPVPGCLAGSDLRRHLVSARKETLLAVRSLIDVFIKQAEEKENRTSQEGTRIKVE